MYDFCLTLPYAALLALGGLMGFLTKGSLPSLLGGLGSAAVLAACGQASLSRYHQARHRTTPSFLLAVVWEYSRCQLSLFVLCRSQATAIQSLGCAPVVLTDYADELSLAPAGRAVPTGDSRLAGGGGCANSHHVSPLAGDRQVHAGGYRGGAERRHGRLLHLEHGIYRAAAAADGAQPVSSCGEGAC